MPIFLPNERYTSLSRRKLDIKINFSFKNSRKYPDKNGRLSTCKKKRPISKFVSRPDELFILI